MSQQFSTPDEFGRLDGPQCGDADMLTAGADRESRLYEDLRRARSQLASYGEALVRIQRSFLPQRLPEVHGLDLAVHFAEAEGVGGDFYEVLPIGSGSWALVVADVSGHGLAAAAILALVHALGNAVRGRYVPPGAALSQINKPLATRYLARTGQFVTAFIGLYDTATRVLTYASAGHPPPRLVRRNEVRRLDNVVDFPLGINETSVYDEASIQLLPGDRLVLFTDGVTESRNFEQDILGDERLDGLLCTPANSAAELRDHVVKSVRTFRGGQAAGDDETCLIAFVNPIQPTNRGESEVVKC
jgi:sigma-B regulation protein RsbU (phosphoserine phosphatase)